MIRVWFNELLYSLERLVRVSSFEFISFKWLGHKKKNQKGNASCIPCFSLTSSIPLSVNSKRYKMDSYLLQFYQMKRRKQSLLFRCTKKNSLCQLPEFLNVRAIKTVLVEDPTSRLSCLYSTSSFFTRSVWGDGLLSMSSISAPNFAFLYWLLPMVLLS